MSKKMVFYGASKPYTILPVDDDNAKALMKDINRAWREGKPITFSANSEGVEIHIRSDAIEAVYIEEAP